MLRFVPGNKSETSVTINFLKSRAGLMYLGQCLPDNSGLAFLGIPFGEHYKLREQLEQLRNSEVLQMYSLEEVEWLRNVSFNPIFFDFKSRTWNFDWTDAENSKEPLLTPEAKEEQAPIIDYKDILILKELQKGVPRTLSKLSKTIEIDQHNLRYHHKHHVRRAISGYYLKMLPVDLPKYQSTLVFIFEPANDQALLDARAVALTIPFTQSVWKCDRNYCWYVSCPGMYTNEVMSYVNEKFLKIPGALRHIPINSSTEFTDTIPHHLFNEHRGCWEYDPEAPLSPPVKK